MARAQTGNLPGSHQGSLGNLITLPQPTNVLEELLFILNLHQDQQHALFKLMEGHLAHLKDLFDTQVPQGYVAGLANVLAANSTDEPVFRPPLFTILLTNAGPGVLEYRIPAKAGANWITLAAGASDYFAFNEPKIGKFGLRTPGPGTVWRAVGVY